MLSCRASRGEIHQLDYGWSITDFEWDLTIRLTTRQDGKTAWGVMLTEIDGNVTSDTGLIDTELVHIDVTEAVHRITSHWIEPLKVNVDLGLKE